MKMKRKRYINPRQLENLRNLISQHIHEILVDKSKADRTFEKIKKYGVSTMPEAVALYKANKKVFKIGA